ncbi:small T antigen [Alphapolyomavirus cardiodermae]|uniref:Small T antigen n=1 Tax=Alphapolyomavirus cardiodermae TaxID=1891718 RepID=L0GC36_9POLY|nr:small T antigen [Alphapolyomavirus cardiodermae]AGA82586.1 small T antigen [Alphapolyomavirus cardiodermae]
MDTALSAYDKLQLCELLGIPRHCYGNYPLMKSSYRQACLKHHPDKGGDDNTMTLLNVLWGKFQTGVYEMRRQFPSFEEVSAPSFWEQDFPTLADKVACGLKVPFYRGPSCLKKKTKDSVCSCVSCRLHRQHHSLKLLTKSNCLVWGQCLCLSCFLLWFGFPLTWECVGEWQKIILHTDFRLLHLQLY